MLRSSQVASRLHLLSECSDSHRFGSRHGIARLVFLLISLSEFLDERGRCAARHMYVHIFTPVSKSEAPSFGLLNVDPNNFTVFKTADLYSVHFHRALLISAILVPMRACRITIFFSRIAPLVKFADR